MAAKTEINLDADGRPSAAGTDTVKTINALIDYLGGGATPSQIVATAAFFKKTVKAGAGVLHSLYVFNTTTSPLYAKFYNKASDPSPSGGDTPIFIVELPPKVGTVDGQIMWSPPTPFAFATGIAMVIVPSLTATNETALSAGDCYGVVGYV